MVKYPGVSPVKPDLLEVINISLTFGGIKAIDSISFSVKPHDICSLIGPNGAGKSSMLNVINGIYQPQRGVLIFDGHIIETMSANQAARLGIGRTFQNIALFHGMTVLDNVLMGLTLENQAGTLSHALRLPRARREHERGLARTLEVIDLLDLGDFVGALVANLAYGIQKRVELARALAAKPKLLLLDEPMAGMTVEEKHEMAKYILQMNKHWGTTVLLIEHDMGVVMDISDHIVALDYGRKIADGPPGDIFENQDVIDAYLGIEH